MEHLFAVTSPNGKTALVLSFLGSIAILKAKQNYAEKIGVPLTHVLYEDGWTARKIEFDSEGVGVNLGWF